MSEQIHLNAIYKAMDDGFTQKCAIKYAVNEICAEIFLETGQKEGLCKLARRVQNAFCGGSVYEHPRKINGWFSYPVEWRSLLWDSNGTIDKFCKNAGLPDNSSHIRILNDICDENIEPLRKGIKIFLYCMANSPFEYSNAIAGRILSAKAMQDKKNPFFAGVSQGLSEYRGNILKIESDIRKNPANCGNLFDELLLLWKNGFRKNLKAAFEIVSLWNNAKKAVSGCGSEIQTLEFYMSAVNDSNVRTIYEWERFSFMGDIKSCMDNLLDAKLAVQRKKGYEIFANIGG